jgi:hypothetical protein
MKGADFRGLNRHRADQAPAVRDLLRFRLLPIAAPFGGQSRFTEPILGSSDRRNLIHPWRFRAERSARGAA